MSLRQKYALPEYSKEWYSRILRLKRLLKFKSIDKDRARLDLLLENSWPAEPSLCAVDGKRTKEKLYGMFKNASRMTEEVVKEGLEEEEEEEEEEDEGDIGGGRRARGGQAAKVRVHLAKMGATLDDVSSSSAGVTSSSRRPKPKERARRGLGGN